MLRTAALLAALSAAVPAAAQAAPSPTGWSRVTVPGHQVSVELPGPTEHKQKERSSIAGHVVTDTVVARDADGWCAATVTTLPGVATLFVSDGGLLERARDKLLEDYGAQSSRWDPVRRDGHDGRRLEFTTSRDPARPERGVAEMFVADGQIVTLLTLRATAAQPLDLEHLFGSIDLPE
jgi:hypothetical protein